MSPCVLDLGMLTTHVDRQQTDLASPAKPPGTAQEFYKSHAMFVAVLEQLQQQLSGLAKEDTPAAPPAILQRVAAKVGGCAAGCIRWKACTRHRHAVKEPRAHMRISVVCRSHFPLRPAQAPTPGLEAYFAQRHPQPPPPANLAEQIDMNLRVLQVLAAEMRGFDALLQGLLGVRPAPRRAAGRPGRMQAAAPGMLVCATAGVEFVSWRAPLATRLP